MIYRLITWMAGWSLILFTDYVLIGMFFICIYGILLFVEIKNGLIGE